MNLRFKREDDYLYVKLNGNYVKGEVESNLNRIFNECRDCDYSKLLLDTREIDYESVNIFDRFHIGVKIAELSSKPPLITVGCMVRKESFGGITETAVKNRGGQFQIFQDENKALSWLSE
ncbi:MAG: hypothetical protein JSV09_00365 [Thermoplasmata archaeon]|nr:MAG: hypothetical protein JSV09_00365 [Thermoplasmata archaeon]